MRTLAVGLLVVASGIAGVALWPDDVAAAASNVRIAAVAAPRAAPPGSEESLARALLALLDERGALAARIAPAVDAGVFAARSLPAAATIAGRGVVYRDLDTVAQGVLWRLAEHFVASLRPLDAADQLQRLLSARDDLSFAWAGDPAPGSACYLRLHGQHAIVEWVRTSDGVVFAAWRDLARDASAEWLREQFVRAHARR
jgi:hypothetical protein